MDIGICVPSHVGDIGYVVRAEARWLQPRLVGGQSNDLVRLLRSVGLGG
jgi:hypothetical protein